MPGYAAWIQPPPRRWYADRQGIHSVVYESTTAGATATLWTDITSTVTCANVTATTWLETPTITTTGTGTTDAVWRLWCNDPAVRVHLTPTERQRLVRQNPEAVAAAAERLRIDGEKHALARQKADTLLHEHLTDQQRASLAANAYFDLDVFSKDGSRRRYRIRRDVHKNVERIDEAGRRQVTYCIQPAIGVPEGDRLLAQKLLLEHNEELFLRTANAQ